MKKKFFPALALFIALTALNLTAFSQITITIPKIPKIKKPKVVQQQPQTESSSPIDDKKSQSNGNQSEDSRTNQNEDAQEQKPNECESKMS